MPIPLLRSSRRTRVQRFYRPAVQMYRRVLHIDRLWRDQSRQEALDDLLAQARATGSALEPRIQTLGLTDAELLAPWQDVLVRAHPLLREALPRLSALQEARRELAHALRANYLPRAEAALGLFNRRVAELQTHLAVLTPHGRPVPVFQQEIDRAHFGVEFLRTHSGSSPEHTFARLMTILEIADLLQQSSLQADIHTVVLLAGINVERLQEQWPDFREALRFLQVAADVPGFGDRVDYLLNRVSAGAISALTASEWSRQVPTFTPEDWGDLVDLLKRSNVKWRRPARSLESMINARFAPIGVPWIWREALGTLAILVVSLTLGILGPDGRASLLPEDEAIARESARPAITEPFNPEFMKHLESLPGFAPAPAAAKDPKREEQIRIAQAELRELARKTQETQTKIQAVEEKLARANTTVS